MSTNFARSVLRVCVAQLCQSMGWNSVQTSALDILSDVLERYLQTTAIKAHRYSEQAGRTDPILSDIEIALGDMGLSLHELEDYIHCLEPVPFTKEVLSFPTAKQNLLKLPSRSSREVLERDEHISEHLPPMLTELEDEDQKVPSRVSTPRGAGLDISMDMSPLPGDKRSYTGETPPPKRQRNLPEEAEPSNYEMLSVVMSDRGFLSPVRTGILPDAKTPEGYKTTTKKSQQDENTPPTVKGDKVDLTSSKSRSSNIDPNKGKIISKIFIKSPPATKPPLSPPPSPGKPATKPLPSPGKPPKSPGRSPKSPGRTPKSPGRPPKSPGRSPGRAKSPKGMTAKKNMSVLEAKPEEKGIVDVLEKLEDVDGSPESPENTLVIAEEEGRKREEEERKHEQLARFEDSINAVLARGNEDKDEGNEDKDEKPVNPTVEDKLVSVSPSPPPSPMRDNTLIDESIDTVIRKSTKPRDVYDFDDLFEPPLLPPSAEFGEELQKIPPITLQTVSTDNKEHKKVKKLKIKPVKTKDTKKVKDKRKQKAITNVAKSLGVHLSVGKETTSTPTNSQADEPVSVVSPEMQPKVAVSQLTPKDIKKFAFPSTSEAPKTADDKPPLAPLKIGFSAPKTADDKPPLAPLKIGFSANKFGIIKTKDKTKKNKKKDKEKKKKHKEKDKERRKEGNKDKDREKDRAKERRKEEKHKSRSKVSDKSSSNAPPSIPKLTLKLGGITTGSITASPVVKSPTKVTEEKIHKEESRPEIPKLKIKPTKPAELSPTSPFLESPSLPLPVKTVNNQPSPPFVSPSISKSSRSEKKTLQPVVKERIDSLDMPPSRFEMPPSRFGSAQVKSTVAPPAGGSSHKVAVTPVRTVITETVGTTYDASGEQIWICPACKKPDDGSPMVGCDACDDWYHWSCVGIVVAPPDDEQWYCQRCQDKKKKKKKKKAKPVF